MSLATYSSIAAFLAHYDVLRAAHAERAPAASAPDPDDAARLTAMDAIIAKLSATDSMALRQDVASIQALGWDAPTTARHRARAELHLRRLLVARGILAG
jgi:hypothetical protein